jgi:diacylglycerol kinase (ATP)
MLKQFWFSALSLKALAPGRFELPKGIPMIKHEEQIQKEAMTKALEDSRSLLSAVMIVNPTSGGYAHHREHIAEHIAFLQHHGWNVDVRLTHAAGQATQWARKAVARHIDVVVAAGGDGTINEIIQELAGSETALGVLPFGTVNVWAREMHIPLDDAGARDVLVEGKTQYIDLGQVNDRFFLLMAGIGLDGEITQAVEKKALKRLGILGYLLASIWYGSRYAGFRVNVTCASRHISTRALQIVIGNTQLYGGVLKFTSQAKCDDGLLDLCVVHMHNIFGRIQVLMDVLLGNKLKPQDIDYATSDAIKVYTRKPIAIQLDGEPAGYTPATFQVIPHTLKVIVPRYSCAG